jgi:acyl phosphate:glycerol-3-phosphate acyltransferase
MDFRIFRNFFIRGDFMISFTLILVLAYLIGSISPSIILSRLIKGVDIRTYGSGNAGMTNAMRLLGMKWGTVVALFDALKGFTASWILTTWLYSAIDVTPIDLILVRILAGSTAMAGHIWTVFFGFKGGKGVLTMAGGILGVAPLQVGICTAIFVFVLLTSRYVSLSSIIAYSFFPVVVFVFNLVFQVETSLYLKIFSFVVAGAIIFTHRENISRLLKGEERKIVFKKQTSDPS